MPAPDFATIQEEALRLQSVEILCTLVNHLRLCRDTATAILVALDRGEGRVAPIGMREEMESLLTMVSASQQRCTVVLSRVVDR